MSNRKELITQLDALALYNRNSGTQRPRIISRNACVLSIQAEVIRFRL